MTQHEIDEARISRSMKRLMELDAPALGQPVRRRAGVLGAVALGLGTVVVMSALLTTSIILHNRSSPGVGASTPTSSTGSAASPTLAPRINQRAVVVGVVAASLTYPGAGVQLDPPGTVLPSLSAATVIGLCGSPQANVTCETGQPKSVELGVLNDAGMHIQGELVWAMTWTNVNCDLMGPQGRPSPNPRVNDATGCDFVTFVDATNGVNPEAIRGPFGL